jgi:chaperonin GroEL
MKEKKARVEDAMHATKAAVEEGIGPGGGIAYLRAIRAIEKLKLDGDQQVGANIMRRALEEPVRQIAANTGAEGSVIVEKLKGSKDNVGFNAATEKVEDLMEAGIIDPAKVCRIAITHSASIASLLLTTEALISEIKDEDEPAVPPMPGGGMGGMY